MHEIDSGYGSVVTKHDRHPVRYDSLGVAEGARESTADQPNHTR